MSFDCFNQATKYDAAELFLPAGLCVLAENGCALVNELVHAPLLYRMRANIMMRGHAHIICDVVVDLVPPHLAFVCTGETAGTAPGCQY